jgi:hypothetical protein
VAALVHFIGCNPAKNNEDASKQKSWPPSVDILLNGPFAIVEQPDGSLVVLLPDIEGHNPPIAVAHGDFTNITTLQRGKYAFSGLVNISGKTTPKLPVACAAIFSVSATAEQLPSKLGETPYLQITLPKPRETSPWNADDLEIASQNPVPKNTPVRRLGTTTILRYDVDNTKSVEMDGPNGFAWNPKIQPFGAERIIAISVEPVSEDDQHTHALDAFKHLTHMLGLSRFVDFPTQTDTRNQPLTPNELPQELTDVLPGLKSVLKGRINDCKAPAVLVTP